MLGSSSSAAVGCGSNAAAIVALDSSSSCFTPGTLRTISFASANSAVAQPHSIFRCASAAACCCRICVIGWAVATDFTARDDRFAII